MNKTAELHRAAIELADRAALAQRRGAKEEFIAHTRAAFDLESEAARLVAHQLELEPTRSVLHRSAASLAIECGELGRAEQLIATALSGNPPQEVADELRDLLENVYFGRHLIVRGVSLEPNEFQMSLAGAAVGFGFARSDHFVGRVKDLETIIYRTAERKLGREFSEAGQRKRGLAKDVELYVAVPRAASLAVTFRLGMSRQLKLPGMDLPNQVISDFLHCIELLNRGDLPQLKSHIGDESYLVNLVSLAQKIAPDGKDVRTVGFTASSVEGGRIVSLSRAKSEFRDLVTPRTLPVSTAVDHSPPVLLYIRGVLLVADARKQQEGIIEVVDGSERVHRVRVPRGMMSDIVKPYFEERVVVLALPVGGTPVLQSIESDDEGS